MTSQAQISVVDDVHCADTLDMDCFSPETPEDSYLLELIAQGDQTAMALLYDRYSKQVYWAALRVLRDVPSAEDIVQEVFMMIWRRPELLARDSPTLKGWMLTVARNRAYDLLRWQRRRPATSIDDVVLAAPCDYAMESEHGIMGERASMMIRQLPDEMRTVIEMAFSRGLTHVEIAAETGYPLGTVKSKIRNGLLRVREMFSVPHGSMAPELRDRQAARLA